jgi:medium-chain acyl-[acyl-carrier-protein] hydrolase
MVFTMQSSDSYFFRPRPNPTARLRLFCFHHAGGSNTLFHHWRDRLPAHVELLLARLPGHGDRSSETPSKRMSPVVREAAEAMAPYLGEPFALFGHSMGASVAFEVARLVRRGHGVQPSRLLVSSCQAPQCLRFALPTYNLPDPEFIEKLRGLNGTPQPLFDNQRLLLAMLPMIRADVELLQTYEYAADAPLDCPITVFGGLQDHVVKLAGLMGWRKQTTAQAVVHLLPGDHFFLNSFQQTFLELLSDELNQCVPPYGVAQGPRPEARAAR